MATDGMVRRWNSVAYSGADERRMDSVLAMPGPAASPFSVRGGRRVNNSGLAVTVGTGPDSATVTAGGGIIYDNTYAAGGGWEFALSSSKTVNLAARPGSGLSRIDLVIARIYDVDSSVGSVRELKIEVIAGTASATPSAPALPALSLELARLTVPNSGTITSTSTTTRTVAAGGLLPVSTTTARTQLVTDGIAYPGLAVFNEQTGRIEVYRGSSTWDQYGLDAGDRKLLVRSGTATIVSNGSGVISSTVAFGGDPMTAAPVVVVGFGAVGAGVPAGAVCRADTFTTTNFRLISNGLAASTSYTFNWVAIVP